MDAITQVLSAIEQGDPKAAERLLPLVYDELRRLAACKLAHEPPGLTLEATALVHEAYMRLAAAETPKRWDNRRHFFSAAAQAMRRILVESARRRRSLKQGGGLHRADIDLDALQAPIADDKLIALDEALEGLATVDPEVAELVRLRYFAGLSIPDAAATLGIAPRTADTWWAYARAWLRAAMEDKAGGSEEC